MIRNSELILRIQTQVGAAIWQCQSLEQTLIHIIIIGFKAKEYTNSKFFENLFEDYNKLTFGRLVNNVKSIEDIPDQIKERLMKLVDERNWLAHKSWAEILPYANSDPPTKLYKFLIRLNNIHDDALSLNKILIEIVEERVKKMGVSTKYLEDKTREIYSRWLKG